MTAQSPSPPPVRQTAGQTTDFPWGPLANSGMGNPFFYHQFADDFDNQLGSTGLYVLSGAGTAAHLAGDGGLALLSSGTTANNFASIQLPAADFTLPTTGSTPPGSSSSVKKLFYLTRIQLSDVTLSSFIAGLCSVTTTPYATGVANVTDGIFFTKAAGSTSISLQILASAGNSPSGAAVSASIAIPAAAYSLVNATSLDMGFYIDRQQNVYVYIGSQLVGYTAQSGTGAVNVSGVSAIPVVGPVASLQQTYTQFGLFPNSTPFTLANLTPTLAVTNGVTAANKTLTVDFHCVQKER